MTTRFPYRWLVAFILLFAYSIQYLDRVIATVLTPSYAKDIGLTTADIGTGVFLMMIFHWGTMVWIPLYLSDSFGFKLATMGWWNSLYFAAAAVGSFGSSWLSDRVFRNNRRVMIVVCFAGVIPFVLLLGSLNAASAGLLALALCGMGFFANMAWGPILALPAEMFSPEVYGKAMGFVNCCGYVAAALATKAFSALVIVRDGEKDYTLGWVFIAVWATVGVIAACFIRSSARAAPPPSQDTAA